MIESTSPCRRSISEKPLCTLCGIIQSSSDRCVLEDGDIVIVTLCDITLWESTRIDFPHIPQRCIISNLELDDCDTFPIPFTLYYNNGEIDTNLCYGIRCDILDKSKELKYSSNRFIPVLTEQHPKTNICISVGLMNNPST